MFCWKCGKQLSDDARFCSECGTPTVHAAGLISADLMPVAENAGIEDGQEPTPELSSAENTIADSLPKQPDTESIPDTLPAAVPDPAAETPSAADAPEQELILRKNRVVFSEEKLQLSKKYYQKKGQRFKIKNGNLVIPLSFISGASILHNRYGRKCAASFLLIIIFAWGTLAGGGLVFGAYEERNAPYRQEQRKQLENALEQLENDGDTELEELNSQLAEVNDKIALLETLQAEYQNGQHRELITQVLGERELALLFSQDYFEDAFEQYITDLLEAFKNDRKLHEWLYTYYVYTLEHGENDYINETDHQDIWFYQLPGGSERFTADLTDGAAFLHNVYEFDLYDLIHSTGRIYLSSSDLMNTVLMMPDYVANGAVFVKAYGGNPEPSKMQVPGWNSLDYADFWFHAEDYYTYDYPFWTDYYLSAEDFALDWNKLTNESVYYSAYVKFMDTIAPGLPVYDKVSYYGSDDAYGGMGFDISGKEAAPTEIALLYLENHPEAAKKLGLDTSTSYDDKIADTQNQLSRLNLQAKELTSRRDRLAAFLDDGDSLRADYEALLQEIAGHRAELNRSLQLFICVTALLFLMTIISLCMFVRYLKKPGLLMVLELADGTVVAFGTAFCSKKRLGELCSKLPMRQE